jgi:MarR family transcriptional regulator, transcriptional regulator for hemolysin
MRRNERIRIGFLIHDVSRLRRTAFDQRMKDMGITRSQWWVLSGISRHNEQGITQTELATVLDLGKVALGGLVDRLEERGFVERRADPADRRINLVHLTPKGDAILHLMHDVGLEMNKKIMKGISPERQHLLAQTLHAMKQNLVSMDTVPGSKARAVAVKSRAPGRRPAKSKQRDDGTRRSTPTTANRHQLRATDR